MRQNVIKYTINGKVYHNKNMTHGQQGKMLERSFAKSSVDYLEKTIVSTQCTL